MRNRFAVFCFLFAYSVISSCAQGIDRVSEDMSAKAITEIADSYLEDKKYQFAGKTGTAQVKKITEKQRELDLDTSQIPYEERDHALYIAFGPYINPRYALSILVEHGGSGSKSAAPIAKKVIKKLLERHTFREKMLNEGKDI